MTLFRPNCRRDNDARGVYHNDDIRALMIFLRALLASPTWPIVVCYLILVAGACWWTRVVTQPYRTIAERQSRNEEQSVECSAEACMKHRVWLVFAVLLVSLLVAPLRPVWPTRGQNVILGGSYLLKSGEQRPSDLTVIGR